MYIDKNSKLNDEMPLIAGGAMVYDGLGAVESITNQTNPLLKCYENTFNAVNYNAKCSTTDPCYSYTFVAKIINTYRQLVIDGKTTVYDRQDSPEEISIIEKDVIEATGEEDGRVKAVLYELYYSVQRGESDKSCLNPITGNGLGWYLYAGIIALCGVTGLIVYKKRNAKRK